MERKLIAIGMLADELKVTYKDLIEILSDKGVLEIYDYKHPNSKRVYTSILDVNPDFGEMILIDNPIGRSSKIGHKLYLDKALELIDSLADDEELKAKAERIKEIREAKAIKQAQEADREVCEAKNFEHFKEEVALRREHFKKAEEAKTTRDPVFHTKSHKLRGISWHPRSHKWRAQIAIDGKIKYGGLYKEYHDAICARHILELCLLGRNYAFSSPSWDYIKGNILEPKGIRVAMPKTPLKVSEKAEKLFLGIDPGVSGAIAFLRETENGIEASVQDFSSHSSQALEYLQNLASQNFTGTLKIYAGLESYQVYKAQNVQNQAKYVSNFGQWLGRLEILGIPTAITHPRTWGANFRRYIDDGTIEVTGNNTKNASLEVARHVYPELAKELRFRKHHNRADAILIAEYVRINHKELEFMEIT